MRFAGNGGQEDARSPDARRRQMVQGVAQHHLYRLGVQMLFKHFQAALHPGLADLAVQRRDHVQHKAAEPHADQRSGHHVAQGFDIVLVDRGHELDQVARLTRGGAGLGLCCAQARRIRQTIEVGRRHRHDAAGPMPSVEQALDRAQALNLLEGVTALAQGVAIGQREAVAALPDAQRVLAQTGVAFDR